MHAYQKATPPIGMQLHAIWGMDKSPLGKKPTGQLYSAFWPYYNHSSIFLNSVNFFCYCLEISCGIWCDIGYYFSKDCVLKPLYLITDTSSNQSWAANSSLGIYRWHLQVFPSMANKAQVANTGKYNSFVTKYL